MTPPPAAHGANSAKEPAIAKPAGVVDNPYKTRIPSRDRWAYNTQPVSGVVIRTRSPKMTAGGNETIVDTLPNGEKGGNALLTDEQKKQRAPRLDNTLMTGKQKQKKGERLRPERSQQN